MGFLDRLRHGQLGSESDRATFRTLHTASLAAPALREGLTEASAERAIRHLHALLGSPAVALTDTHTVLAWDGTDPHHREHVAAVAARVGEAPGTTAYGPGELPCERPACSVRRGVAVPLVVEDRTVGTLQVLGTSISAGMLRAAEEVAGWVSGQLALAELEATRTRTAEAELRALRAQISPHFVYNSLTAIASFVRTDPDRARELLLEFADFTRYSFRRHGEFTTLAEELRSIERYLVLEQARFGERLQVRLRVAPEVLGVTIPFLCLQPLVENAVRHGLESQAGGGTITIEARDLDRVCEITVEDDGAGEDPETVRRALAGRPTGTSGKGDSVGLGNVDERLRSIFGEEHGLVVETAPGAGTRVTVRVPKYAPGVHT